MFVRSVKVPASSGSIHEYVRVVESYREDGKIRQRVVADLGRKDVLQAMLPKLQRVLRGEPAGPEAAQGEVEIVDASTWGPVLVVRQLFDELGLWQILDQHLGRSRGVPYPDRAFVLVANRLIAPRSEHGLAGWLETDYVCDRQGRRFLPRWHQRGRVRVHHQQLGAWYRTLDRLVAAKLEIERVLYHRLRDLFSFRPELVLYDITSTYFEGAGPPELARHGYSRDNRPDCVQVVIGVVMVAGWPIAHHVWEGNRVDATTVGEVIEDLCGRFDFGRIVFVGDRGMTSQDNLDELVKQGHGYLLGVRRRRNAELDRWLQAVDETKWLDCPVGITAREKKNPPRTRVQEIPSDDPQRRVFVIDSDERREFEQAMRSRAMEPTRRELERLAQRVARGQFADEAAIGAAAERILRRRHGWRYYDWEVRRGVFHFFEHPVHLEREKRLEGKYVVISSEQDLSPQEAVARYKELSEVERGFRQMKDVLAMRPVWHQRPDRVQGHVFVAALGLLLSRLLERRLEEAGVDLSAAAALQAASTLRAVRFHLDGQPPRLGASRGAARARQVLRALGIQTLKPPAPPHGPPTIM